MKNLNEELLRQLLLMNFDGSKTLLEQEVPSDRLGNKGDFQANRNATNTIKTDKEIYEEDKRVATSSFRDIVNEIDGGWAPWKWGTNKQSMTDAILRIKNQQQYNLLRKNLTGKYKGFKDNTILGFIQEQEFSTGVDPKSNDALRNLRYGILPVFPGQEYQYQTNDYFLRKMESHLQKFNPLEKFSISEAKSLITTILPPAASAAAHTILPLLTIALSAFPPAAIATELQNTVLITNSLESKAMLM